MDVWQSSNVSGCNPEASQERWCKSISVHQIIYIENVSVAQPVEAQGLSPCKWWVQISPFTPSRPWLRSPTGRGNRLRPCSVSVRITLELPKFWKIGRNGNCSSLENCSLGNQSGFESLIFRQTLYPINNLVNGVFYYGENNERWTTLWRYNHSLP